MRLQREVAGVKEADDRAGNVAFERLRTGRQEEGIVLAPILPGTAACACGSNPGKLGALDGVHAGPRGLNKRGQLRHLRFRMFLADRVAGSLFGCTWPRNGHGSSRCRQRVLQPARELQWREALARVEIVLTR